MRERSTAWWVGLIVVAAGLSGCAASSMTEPTRDLGTRTDAAVDAARPDAGPEDTDMGPPPDDMGPPPPPVDMGPPPPPVDMGPPPPPMDMGPPPPPVDMGPPVPHPASAGALIITEILYDPTAVPDEMGEWIELFNPGGEILFLGDCVLADASAMGRHTIDPAAGLRIGPGEYLVIARSSMPGFEEDYSIDDGFALNNSGVETVSLTCGGVIIDSVTYDSGSWPDPTGGSISLDPSSFDATDNDSPSSWCAATATFASGDRGTPGQDNPPCGAMPTDAGPVDMGPADAGPMDMGPTDAGPRDMGPTDMGMPMGTTPSAAGQLVISEIMYDPTTEPAGEWFEVYNPSTTVTYDLLNCLLRDNTAMHTITASVVIPPGAYRVLGRTLMTGFAHMYGGLALANGADLVSITCGMTMIDTVAYDDSPTGMWPNAVNASVQLSPTQLTAAANDSPASWCASTMMTTLPEPSTPGMANAACP